MLDRTSDTTQPRDATQRADKPAAETRRNAFAGLSQRIADAYRESRLRSAIQRAWQFFISQSFSSLTRRIVFLNVAGLLALVVGILYLSQFRAGLIDARVQSLVVQGEIIAGAIAAAGTSDSYSGSADRGLELQPGENYGQIDEGVSRA